MGGLAGRRRGLSSAKPVNHAELRVRVRNLLRLKAYSQTALEDEVGLRTADLVESERLYRSTFDAAPRSGSCTWAWTGSGCESISDCAISWDTRARCCRGIGVRDASSRPEDAAGDAEALRQMAAGTLDRHVIDGTRYRRRDGSVDVGPGATCPSIATRTIGPSTSSSVIEDITERRALEAQRADDERRVNLALDAAWMGTWELDLATDTSVRSLRHDQIFGHAAMQGGWSRADLLASIVPDDRPAVHAAFEEAFRTGAFRMECRIRWPDTSLHWISARRPGRSRHPRCPRRRSWVSSETSPSASAARKELRAAKTPPRRPTRPRASSWPT